MNTIRTNRKADTLAYPDPQRPNTHQPRINEKPTETYVAINKWRAEERPREKLHHKGAENLTDAELIAILIKQGTRGVSALDIGKQLLREFKSLSGIAARDITELRNIRGMGLVKAITLAAAFEVARRIETEPFASRRIIRCPDDVAGLYIPRLRGLRTETFRVLLLNTSNQIIRECVISEGSLNASIVHPREVYRVAIIESAASIIVVHNHPSGNTQPSQEDIEITKQLVTAGATLGIPLNDHIIIAGEEFTSLAELNYL